MMQASARVMQQAVGSIQRVMTLVEIGAQMTDEMASDVALQTQDSMLTFFRQKKFHIRSCVRQTHVQCSTCPTKAKPESSLTLTKVLSQVTVKSRCPQAQI